MLRPVFEPDIVHHIDLAQVRFAYRQVGTGPGLVLLLHGRPQTGLCWRYVVPNAGGSAETPGVWKTRRLPHTRGLRCAAVGGILIRLSALRPLAWVAAGG
ncbi:hypothetical protein GCM10009780_20040 [Actinomadura alba]